MQRVLGRIVCSLLDLQFKQHVECQLLSQEKENMQRVLNAKGGETVYFQCMNCIRETLEFKVCGAAEREDIDRSVKDEEIMFRCKRCFR
jgi:hypothetical protein